MKHILLIFSIIVSFNLNILHAEELLINASSTELEDQISIAIRNKFNGSYLMDFNSNEVLWIITLNTNERGPYIDIRVRVQSTLIDHKEYSVNLQILKEGLKPSTIEYCADETIKKLELLHTEYLALAGSNQNDDKDEIISESNKINHQIAFFLSPVLQRIFTDNQDWNGSGIQYGGRYLTPINDVLFWGTGVGLAHTTVYSDDNHAFISYNSLMLHMYLRYFISSQIYVLGRQSLNYVFSGVIQDKSSTFQLQQGINLAIHGGIGVLYPYKDVKIFVEGSVGLEPGIEGSIPLSVYISSGIQWEF